ncbi:MAG: condensation domain-containing protein, partial [Acidobacteriota bacterium]
IGEYVAASLADVLPLEQAVMLVAKRGQLMAGLPEGAMLSAALPANELESLLGHELSLAADNGPSLSVASGPTEAIARLADTLASRDVEHRQLHTSHAFHSAMVEPILGPFGELLAKCDLQPPQRRYVSNVTGDWIRDSEATDPAYWVRHLRHTVRFRDGLGRLLEEPQLALLEVGPGRALGTLARRHPAAERGRVVVSAMPHARDKRPDLMVALTALGRLWLAGAEIDWQSLHIGRRRRTVLPTYPFERQRYWVEAPAAGMATLLPSGAGWSRAPLGEAGGDLTGPWLVFVDRAGLGRRLVERLTAAGETVWTVASSDSFAADHEAGYRLEPRQIDGYQMLWSDLSRRGIAPQRIVHLWSFGDDADASSIGGLSLMHLAAMLGGHKVDSLRLDVVTSGASRLADEAPSDPGRAGIAGICEVSAAALPGVMVRTVDLSTAVVPEALETLAEQLVAELRSSAAATQAVWRNGERWQLAANPSDTETLPGLDEPAPLPEAADRPPLETSYVAPRGATEEALAALWQKLLGIGRVGIHDDFFDLGGHSLLATQVLTRVRETFAAEIPLDTFFETPTVAGLAARLDAAESVDTALAPIEPVPRTEGPLLLSFAQQRMWFLHQLDPVSTAYHLPFAVRLEGALDPVALYHSLAEVVRRHEVLRTVFVEVDGEPRQDIIATRSLTLPFVDLSVVTATQRETVAQQLAQELIGEPFRLDHGSLLRVLLLALDASRHVLVGVMHHIVSDGWSTALLTREVATLYHAYHGGQPSPLAELPIQYADFAMWQQRWLESEAAVEQLDYWRQQLGGEPPALALPADRPRPEHQSFRGGRCFLELDAELTGRLRALGRRRSTSLFVTLLTAWKGLLARYTGQRDIAVGTPVANRRWGEIESLIGFFANTLVLRTDLGRDRDFLSLLERVRNVCMGGFAHQDLPFDKLVEVLAPERDTSRQALFQVMFGLQNMPAEDLELPGLVLTPFELEIDSAPFDLTLLLEERDGLLRGALRYSTDLFDEATAAQLIHHYEVLLRRVEATPERPLSTLALLRHQEELQLCQADRPAGASAIYVLDGSLHAVPVGMIGELYIASEGPPVGSLEAGTEAGTETAQQWPNPFSTEAGGWLQRVGERGRRLRDGRLWIAGPVEEAAILAGLRLDCEAIRQVLLADPAIVDCALARRYHQQDARLLAYVVASGPLPVDRLRARLAERFPAAALPAAWVPVTTLPLTADGEVDMEALGRLEILDETVAERWQQRLATLPGVDDDAVVVRQRAHPIARQHLSDLLPDWSPIPVADATGGVKESVDEPSASSTATESARPAISHGDPLDRPADDVTTLQAALLRAAATSPEVGLVQLEGDGTEHLLPYADLPAAASRVLAGLRRLGLRAGDPVIFQLQRAHEFLLTFWGCQLGGMVPVPVAIPAGYEDNTAAGKLGDVWQMLDRPPIVTDTASGPAIHALLADDQAEAPRVVEIEALRRNEQDSEWHRAVPQEPAVMFLTSGSTGLPKGVPQSHAALLSMAAGTRQMNGFGSHDTSLNWMPLDHVGAVSFLHVLPLYLCCQQVHAPTASILQEPLRWLDWIERHRATISWAPNFAFALINDRAEEIGGRRWDLSSLGFLVNAGEAVSARAVRRFLDLLGRQGLPDNALRPAFGMSETCSGITWSSGFSLADSSDDLRFVELGRPIPGAALRIVDEAGKVVETNSVGQLQAMGPSVLAGYYNNPEANSEALVGDGWFNTGDLGLLDEHGRLVITGREKDVIIVRGVSLYCQEIESVVDEIPAVEVSFTAACALYDATIGADRLAIFFNTQDNDEDRLAELIREIRGRVNQAVGANPDYLLPVRHDEIPKTSIGKIQRAQLVERLRHGAFDSVLKRMDLLLANAKTLPGWFFRRVWRQRQLVHRHTSHSRAARGRTLILADRLGLGEVIAGRLGASAICLAAGKDYRPRLAELDPETDRVLDLRTYGGGVGSPWDEAELEQAQESAAYGLL